MPELPDIESLLADQKGRPPVDQWQPDFSGDIDIRIDRRGDWYHEGKRFERTSLVKLFASILRRETDGEYYLVTPVEKWRVQVEDLPLLIVESREEGSDIALRTNLDDWLKMSAQYPLSVDEDAQGSPLPAVALWHGLSARVGRNVFYRWCELAQESDGELLLHSAGQSFSLGRI